METLTILPIVFGAILFSILLCAIFYVMIKEINMRRGEEDANQTRASTQEVSLQQERQNEQDIAENEEHQDNITWLIVDRDNIDNPIHNEADDNNIINIMTDENKSSEPEITEIKIECSADQELSSNEEQEKEERKIIEIKNEEREAEAKKNPVPYKKNKTHNNSKDAGNINKENEINKTYRNIHNTAHHEGLRGDFARRHDYLSYHNQFRDFGKDINTTVKL